MKLNELSDADIEAVAIVGKGANRKRWFLKKEHAEPEDLVTFPGSRLVKAEDWSAVYCVVAEPGAIEDPGLTGSLPDIWRDAEEIRKAAHRFMANGGLVTKLHESLEPYGTLVENAVALDDFNVEGETIKKGSWYVAISPSPEGREKIDAGEFGGISIEGAAIRTTIEKDDPEIVKTSVQQVALQRMQGWWRKAAPTLGVPGAKSPRIHFITAGQGYLYTAADPDGVLAISVSPSAATQMASDKPEKVAEMEFSFYHECARFYQGSAVWNSPSANAGSGTANGYANQMRQHAKGDKKADPKAYAKKHFADVGKPPRSIAIASKEDADPKKKKKRKVGKRKPFDEAKHKRQGGKFAATGSVGTGAKPKPGTPKGTKATTAVDAQANRDRTAANILGALNYSQDAAGVKAFQRTHHLPETGTVDAGTLKAMRHQIKGHRRKQHAVGLAVGRGKVKKMRGIFERIGKALGIPEDELAAELDAFEDEDDLAKAMPTFAERMAQRELDDELPDAMDVLRSTIFRCYSPYPEDGDVDPEAVISDSLDQFKEWCLDLLSRATPEQVAKSIEEADLFEAALGDVAFECDTWEVDEEGEQDVAKAAMTAADRKKLPKSAFVFPEKAPGSGSYPIHNLAHAVVALGRSKGKPEQGAVRSAVHSKYPNLKKKPVKKLGGSTSPSATLGDEMWSPEEIARVDKLEKAVEELPGKVAESVTKAAEDAAKNASPPTAAELGEQLGDLKKATDEKFDAILEGVKKLGSGESTQTGGDDEERTHELSKAAANGQPVGYLR